MSGTMRIIRADGTQTTQTDLTDPPSLPTLQAAVGGYIETVPGFDWYEDQHAVAFCNEEGKIMGKAVNQDATRLWAESLQYEPNDILVGDVVIVYGDESFMDRV